MKVYVVEEFDGESFHILKIFSDENKAKDYIDYEKKQGYYDNMICREYEVK